MVVNIVKVESARQLSEEELQKISDIMRHSQCQNESLINSFEDCLGYRFGIIYFGKELPANSNDAEFVYQVEY